MFVYDTLPYKIGRGKFQELVKKAGSIVEFAAADRNDTAVSAKSRRKHRVFDFFLGLPDLAFLSIRKYKKLRRKSRFGKQVTDLFRMQILYDIIGHDSKLM